MGVSLEDRFWSKVDVGGQDDCWPWNAYCNSDGYGKFRINGESRNAHRIAFILTFGEPDNNVLHSCDNPPCCNSNHLRDGTQAENVNDREKRNRRQPPIGVLNGRAKLSVEQVFDIQNSLDSSGALATKYSVDRQTIWRIRSGKGWKNV